LELVGHRFRMLDDDLDAEFLCKPVADGLQAVIALVAVDPDEELAVLEGRAQRSRSQKGSRSKAEQCGLGLHLLSSQTVGCETPVSLPAPFSTRSLCLGAVEPAPNALA